MTEPAPFDSPAHADQPHSSKRGWLIAGLVLVVLLVGAAAVYLALLPSESPEKLQLDSSPSTPPAIGDAPLPGNWIVVSGSTAGYRVRERLARLPAPSDAVGRTSDVKGGFTVAQQSGAYVASNMRVDVNVTTLASDEGRRDNRIKTTGLESNKYPTATFVATEPVTIPESAAGSGKATTSVTGDLTIHGVAKRVTIPLDVQRSGNNIEIVGSLTFPFADFNMTPPDVANVVTVDPNATLEFKLVFSKA